MIKLSNFQAGCCEPLELFGERDTVKLLSEVRKFRYEDEKRDPRYIESEIYGERV